MGTLQDRPVWAGVWPRLSWGPGLGCLATVSARALPRESTVEGGVTCALALLPLCTLSCPGTAMHGFSPGASLPCGARLGWWQGRPWVLGDISWEGGSWGCRRRASSPGLEIMSSGHCPAALGRSLGGHPQASCADLLGWGQVQTGDPPGCSDLGWVALQVPGSGQQPPCLRSSPVVESGRPPGLCSLC